MVNKLKSVVFFGKGGIGKSTISSNMSAILGKMGHKVLHIGCDPKMDSTIGLTGKTIIPFSAADLNPEIVGIGIRRFVAKSPYIPNVDCVEAGGPDPGIGCAGIAIGNLLDTIHAERLLEKGQYNRAIYDVLGDVVCGGFAAPLRKGFAKKAVIVSSEEILSLYAANNLLKMLLNFSHNGVYAAGLALNIRDEAGLDHALKYAELAGLRILGILHRDKAVYEASRLNKAAILHFPGSMFAKEMVRLAIAIEKANPPTKLPVPLTENEFAAFAAGEDISPEAKAILSCPNMGMDCPNLHDDKQKRTLYIKSLESNGIDLMGVENGELILSYSEDNGTLPFRIVPTFGVEKDSTYCSDWQAFRCGESERLPISEDLKSVMNKYSDYSYGDFMSLIADKWKKVLHHINNADIGKNRKKSSSSGNSDRRLIDISDKFRTYILPYQIGVYLGINAICDAALLNDGPNCSIPKAEFIYGNHDINSTLFSKDGTHRIFYTMSHPIKQKGNPEYKIETMLSILAECGKFGIVFATALPFQSLTGIDYDGIAACIDKKVPVVAVPPKSMELDWLGGYSAILEAAASALDYNVHRKKNTVTIVGYLFDRNEGDHKGNIRELRHLLALCGLDLTCVFPDGGFFSNMQKAAEADYIISFPYSRNAARSISRRSGAKLIETDIPIGFKATTEWIEKICCETGRPLPETILIEERRARRQYNKFASVLRHKPVIFAGDPYLFDAINKFCLELYMRPNTAFLDCYPRKVRTLPARLLFRPSSESARNMATALEDYEKPTALIGNSFSFTEKFATNIPFVELGFPSYSFHCLMEEPFMGYAGTLCLAGRMLNAFMR